MPKSLSAPAETLPQKQAREEAALVQAARRDPAAFAALYRRYVTPIYRYLYSRVGLRADAEDLTGQTFTEALAGLDRYREQGSFAAWLFTIARQRATDHYRRQRRDLPLEAMPHEPVDHQPTPWAYVCRQETLRQVAGLIADLAEDKQELLRLRFAAGLSYRQVGELTGRSEAATKMAIHRLLRRLKAAWEVNYE